MDESQNETTEKPEIGLQYTYLAGSVLRGLWLWHDIRKLTVRNQRIFEVFANCFEPLYFSCELE